MVVFLEGILNFLNKIQSYEAVKYFSQDNFSHLSCTLLLLWEVKKFNVLLKTL